MIQDMTDGLGATITGFREALKAAAGPATAHVQGMGLYDVAMKAGHPGLGGFAPGGAIVKRMGGVTRAAGMALTKEALQTARVMSAAGAAAGMPAGVAKASEDLSGSAAMAGENPPVEGRSAAVHGATGPAPVRQNDQGAPSYRLAVAQARADMEIGRDRREVERVALRLPARGEAVTGQAFAPPGRREESEAHGLGPRRQLGEPASAWASGHGRLHDAADVRAVVRAGGREAAGSQGGDMSRPSLPGSAPPGIAEALDEYFFRRSRLAPAGGAGFNPMLSPVWAGLKIPG